MSFQKPEKDFGEGPVRRTRYAAFCSHHPQQIHTNHISSLQKVHKIRITLTSRKVASLEKVCQELIDRARSKSLHVKGPVRLPTKTLHISTRKTPNGEGSKTWDKYEMRIHKRLIE